jgi:hypothetical protein
MVTVHENVYNLYSKHTESDAIISGAKNFEEHIFINHNFLSTEV